jgi:pantetheine-phosphate adenylyltransferase
MKRVGVYAGSFDPPTNGHYAIIQQAVQLFDELHLWVAVNPDKKYRFAGSKRVEVLKAVASEIARALPTDGPLINVSEIRDGFLVDHIKRLSASRHYETDTSIFLVRGIRNMADFEMERPMRHLNSKMSGGQVETVFLMAPKEVEDLSSSIVNGLVGPVGWRRVVKPLVPAGTYAAIEENVGWQRWSALWDRLLKTPKPESVREIFDDLVKRYREHHRHYHTLNHILACFEQVQQIRGAGGHVPDVVEIALWFHDAIYVVPDPERTSEPKSAELAVAALDRLGRSDLAELVRNAILATGGGALASDDRLETRMTVEADLSILGADQMDYVEYVQQIRAEYSMVPPELFRAGRTEFMKVFLDNKIFRLKEFAAFEEPAKRNIRSEMPVDPKGKE